MVKRVSGGWWRYRYIEMGRLLDKESMDVVLVFSFSWILFCFLWEFWDNIVVVLILGFIGYRVVDNDCSWFFKR